jgi:hypothetical protein
MPLLRVLLFVIPERGELCMGCFGDLATRLGLDRLRRGVIRVSADLPDRTGRDTEARAVGSEGREATSR